MTERPVEIKRRIARATRKAIAEGREEDPYFLDWVGSQERLIDEYRTARWYVEEIRLGSGSFGT